MEIVVTLAATGPILTQGRNTVLDSLLQQNVWSVVRLERHLCMANCTYSQHSLPMSPLKKTEKSDSFQTKTLNRYLLLQHIFLVGE